MDKEFIRAFSDPDYDYYRLKKPFGMLPAGTIFVHDPDDHMYGSPARGCLKNCWTPDGDCYGGLCGGTVFLHYDFVHTDWFEKAECSLPNVIKSLTKGTYELKVYGDEKWSLTKYGTAEE